MCGVQRLLKTFICSWGSSSYLIWRDHSRLSPSLFSSYRCEYEGKNKNKWKYCARTSPRYLQPLVKPGVLFFFFALIGLRWRGKKKRNANASVNAHCCGSARAYLRNRPRREPWFIIIVFFQKKNFFIIIKYRKETTTTTKRYEIKKKQKCFVRECAHETAAVTTLSAKCKRNATHSRVRCISVSSTAGTAAKPLILRDFLLRLHSN